MKRNPLTRWLLCLMLVFAPLSGAFAASVNGGWLADSGDLLFIAKATNGTVVVMDVAADKSLRYVFTGTLIGDQLQVETRDGTADLQATVSGEELTGELSSADGTEAVHAKLYYAYQGSTYDGLWQNDPASEDYWFYATVKIKGMAFSLVPTVAFKSDGSYTYNFFIGAPAAVNDKGESVYSGMAASGTDALKLTFTSNKNANAMLVNAQGVTKFAIKKIYAVTKKSGGF